MIYLPKTEIKNRNRTEKMMMLTTVALKILMLTQQRTDRHGLQPPEPDGDEGVLTAMLGSYAGGMRGNSVVEKYLDINCTSNS
jgi:hypothetical protein